MPKQLMSEFSDQRIIVDHGSPELVGKTLTNMQANHPYGYRAIICPECNGVCLWLDGDPAACAMCQGRGVIALRFSSM